ncbi:MAG: GntR family transcriptional regulator [Phycisphaeraceae bacterium]
MLSERRKGLAEPLRLPVEQAIAEEHSVARDTVRRALKLLEDRGAVTRRRGLGTFLQPLRAPLASLRGATVGFVPPWWVDSSGGTGASFTSNVLEGVSRWADTQRCQLAVLHAKYDVGEFDKWLNEARERSLAGVIWVHPQLRQLPLVERCAKHVPSIVLGRHYPGRQLHHVTPDYAQAAQLVDDHLVAHGHDIYTPVVLDQMETYNRDWIEGIQAAQERRGQQFNSHYQLLDIKGFDRDKLATMLQEFYEPVHPTVHAFVLPTSSLLVPLLADERFRGRLRAGEVSVITMDFGVYPIGAYWTGHTVDHIACDWVAMGRRAMENLALLVAGHPVPELLREPVSLVTGETVHRMEHD